jgi:tetratricopeptide (TPR) repeat protein
MKPQPALVAALIPALAWAQIDEPPPRPKESRSTQIRREASLHLRRGLNALNDREFELAAKELEALLRVELANPLAYYLLGICRLELQRFREALAAFRTVVDISPREAGAYHAMGLVHARQQDWEAAARACLLALRLNKKHARAWNDLGIAYARLGRYSRAQSAFRSALEVEPAHAEALVNLVLLQVSLGDGGEAVETVERWLSSRPEDPAALALGVTLKRHQGDGVGAATYSARLDALPASQRELAKSLGDLSGWLDQGPASATPEQLELARALLERSLAEQSLQLLPEQEPGAAAMLRAEVLFTLGRFRESAASLAQVGAAAPSLVLHYNRALALELAGAADRALEEYRAALEQDASFAPALYRIGSLQLAREDYRAALEAFQRLIEVAPSHILAEPAARRVAELRRRLGR